MKESASAQEIAEKEALIFRDDWEPRNRDGSLMTVRTIRAAFLSAITAAVAQHEQERTMKCPYCGFGLLWSEDRGAHCDGCDDFDAAAVAQTEQDTVAIPISGPWMSTQSENSKYPEEYDVKEGGKGGYSVIGEGFITKNQAVTIALKHNTVVTQAKEKDKTITGYTCKRCNIVSAFTYDTCPLCGRRMEALELKEPASDSVNAVLQKALKEIATKIHALPVGKWTIVLCEIKDIAEDALKEPATESNLSTQKALALLSKTVEFLSHHEDCPEFLGGDESRGCECLMPPLRDQIQWFLSEHSNAAGADQVSEDTTMLDWLERVQFAMSNDEEEAFLSWAGRPLYKKTVRAVIRQAIMISRSTNP